MKIYLELTEDEQNLITTLVPQNYSLAVKVRLERKRLKELEESKITSAKLKRDVRIFLTENGGYVKYLKAQENPRRLSKHRNPDRKKVRAQKLINSLTPELRKKLLIKLREDLKDERG